METRRVGRHQEGRQSALAAFRLGRGKDDCDAGALAVGDELLVARQHPAVIGRTGACAQVVGLRAGLRLGQAERTDQLAAGQRRQIAILLRFGAVVQDRAAADRAVHAHQRRASRAAGGDLLDRQRVGDVVRIGAAPLLGHDHAEQAERAHLGDDLVGQLSAAVPLRGVRLQTFLGEGARGVADHSLLLGVFAVHGAVVGWSGERD